MKSSAVHVMILAAGRSSRFRSATPKILHPLAGRSLLEHVITTATALAPRRIVPVIAPASRDAVTVALQPYDPRISCAVQKEPLGTAHAVRCAQPLCRGAEWIVILSGDVPLVRPETLRTFIGSVQSSQAVGGLISMRGPDPTGYGRIVRTTGGALHAIVEERDADAATRRIDEVNTGIFCVRAAWLWKALANVGRTNAQREYYLPEIVGMAREASQEFVAVLAEDATEFLGVNSRADLASVSRVLQQRLTRQWMAEGVTFVDPSTVQLDVTVQLAMDCVIGPHVALHGDTRLGAGCTVEQGAILRDTRVAAGVHIKPYSVIEGAVIGPRCQIGPFARLRPESQLDADVRIGNFVETKKVRLRRGVKANHLTYLGDATVGADTNIGCGTITCNYDGTNKWPTVIGDGVFVGSDVQFVAPVRIGRGAVIGAGSVITDNVPAEALALARGRQVVKRGWACAQQTKKRR